MVQLEGLRQAIHTAAEQLRALSDDELVALALKASPTRALREELQHEERAKPVRRAKAKREVAPAREASTGRKSPVQDAVLGVVDATPRGPAEIGKAAGVGTNQTAATLSRLFSRKMVSRTKGPRGWLYSIAGRQTGARKASKPARSSDEEEGPAVKLSVVSSAPDALVRSRSRHSALGASVLELLAKGPLTTVQLVEALEADELAARGAIAYLRLNGFIFQDRKGQPWKLTHAAAPSPNIPKAPESEPRRLPVLVYGRGERHEDCAHYDECLGRFVKRFPSASSAECPKGCTSRTDTPAHVKLAIASSYGRQDLTVI